MKFPSKAYCLFLFTSIAYGQYSAESLPLAETVFTGTFDKNVIFSYLSSAIQKEQEAAFLAIAQSADTSFVDALIRHPSESATKYFAVGKLRLSQKSADWLLKKLPLVRDSETVKQIFIAVGRIGDESTALKLIELYHHHSLPYLFGFPNSLYEFWQRERRPKEIKSALLSLFTDLKIDSPILSQALSVSARIGPDSSFIRPLHSITTWIEPKSTPEDLIQNLLVCIRRLKKNNEFLAPLSKFLENGTLIAKIESARILCANEISNDELNQILLQLLEDPNENVRLHTTSSLRTCRIASRFRDSIEAKVEKYFEKENKSEYAKCEYGLTLISLDTTHKREVERLYPGSRLVRLYASYPDLFDNELCDYLNHFHEVAKQDRFFALNSIITLRDDTRYQAHIDHIAAELLRGTDPYLISLILENADSMFVFRNREILITIIPAILARSKNEPEYADVLAALLRLRAYLPEFSQALQSATANAALRRLDFFNECFAAAFKYSAADILTTKGVIKIRFNPGIAPVTCGSFALLAEQEFFNGVKFHRVVPGFVIQTGDPTGTGSGGPGYQIISEFSPLHYSKGIVGMASAGTNTEGSQWFITTGDYAHLDGRYTVFAEVISGQDIADQIIQEDSILSIRLLK